MIMMMNSLFTFIIISISVYFVDNHHFQSNATSLDGENELILESIFKKYGNSSTMSRESFVRFYSEFLKDSSTNYDDHDYSDDDYHRV